MVNVSPDAQREVHEDAPRTSRQLRSAKPGDIVTFGRYPQKADGIDRTPIKWRVLENCGKELFLLSEYIVDCKRYHGEYRDTAWRDCDLRQWLNVEFYRAAFTAAQKSLVKTTRCTDNGEDRPDTKDKVFLLSVTEAKELTGKRGEDSSRAERRARGTEFAKTRKKDGCHLYSRQVYGKKVSDDYLVENGEEFGCSWWWLRTQGTSSSRAFFVGTRSSIRSYGRVDLACYGVRPALRLTLFSRNTRRHDR